MSNSKFQLGIFMKIITVRTMLMVALSYSIDIRSSADYHEKNLRERLQAFNAHTEHLAQKQKAFEDANRPVMNEYEIIEYQQLNRKMFDLQQQPVFFTPEKEQELSALEVHFLSPLQEVEKCKKRFSGVRMVIDDLPAAQKKIIEEKIALLQQQRKNQQHIDRLKMNIQPRIDQLKQLEEKQKQQSQAIDACFSAMIAERKAWLAERSLFENYAEFCGFKVFTIDGRNYKLCPAAFLSMERTNTLSEIRQIRQRK